MLLTVTVLEISEISSQQTPVYSLWKVQKFLEHFCFQNNSEWFSLNGYFLNGDINFIFEVVVFSLYVALAN